MPNKILREKKNQSCPERVFSAKKIRFSSYCYGNQITFPLKYSTFRASFISPKLRACIAGCSRFQAIMINEELIMVHFDSLDVSIHVEGVAVQKWFPCFMGTYFLPTNFAKKLILCQETLLGEWENMTCHPLGAYLSNALPRHWKRSQTIIRTNSRFHGIRIRNYNGKCIFWKKLGFWVSG